MLLEMIGIYSIVANSGPEEEGNLPTMPAIPFEKRREEVGAETSLRTLCRVGNLNGEVSCVCIELVDVNSGLVLERIDHFGGEAKRSAADSVV